MNNMFEKNNICSTLLSIQLKSREITPAKGFEISKIFRVYIYFRIFCEFLMFNLSPFSF